MKVDVNLICARLQGPEKGIGLSCVHLWTYDKNIIKYLGEEFLAYSSESTRRMWKDRGVKV
jgi:hypothetical protein